MRKLSLCLLLLVVFCSPSYSVEPAPVYPVMSNAEVVETFLAIFDELDAAYESYANLRSAMEYMDNGLRMLSQQLQTGADSLQMMSSESSTQTTILSDMETSVMLTEIAFNGYAVKQRRRMIALTATTLCSLAVAIVALVLR